MTQRSVSGWLVAIVLLAMLFGIVGGGVMGGAVSYYVLRMQPQATAPAPAAELAVAKSNPAQTAPSQAITQTVTENSATIDVAKKAEPAVVTIINTMQSRSSRRFGNMTPTAEGSGVIIDQQGHIVTNAHVVDGAAQLQVVYSDGTKVDAKLIGADTNNDIAVLQVSGKVPAYLSFGDSNTVQPGESVIAIGSALGTYEGSVTTGIVSGLNRSVDGSGMSGLIQTDAAINHGNSGGPLLNLSGQVIGINTLVVRVTDSGDVAEGLGFAIPSNTVTSVVQKILSQGGNN